MLAVRRLTVLASMGSMTSCTSPSIQRQAATKVTLSSTSAILDPCWELLGLTADSLQVEHVEKENKYRVAKTTKRKGERGRERERDIKKRERERQQRDSDRVREIEREFQRERERERLLDRLVDAVSLAECAIMQVAGRIDFKPCLLQKGNPLHIHVANTNLLCKSSFWVSFWRVFF